MPDPAAPFGGRFLRFGGTAPRIAPRPARDVTVHSPKRYPVNYVFRILRDLPALGLLAGDLVVYEPGASRPFTLHRAVPALTVEGLAEC